MKAWFAKKLPLVSAFADVLEETLLENLIAFQKRTKKMRDSTLSLTMIMALPWFDQMTWILSKLPLHYCKRKPNGEELLQMAIYNGLLSNLTTSIC